MKNEQPNKQNDKSTFPLVFLLVLIFPIFLTWNYIKVDTTNNNSITNQNKLIEKGTLSDKRDNKSYSWIKFNNGKKWMTENLNFEIEGSWCFDNESINCTKYGRLYTWDAANKACPKDWRLPRDGEWQKMIKSSELAYQNKENQKKNKIKKSSKLFIGDTSLDISIIFPSLTTENSHSNDASDSYWSNTSSNTNEAWNYTVKNKKQDLFRGSVKKSEGSFCRCIQD